MFILCQEAEPAPCLVGCNSDPGKKISRDGEWKKVGVRDIWVNMSLNEDSSAAVNCR